MVVAAFLLVALAVAWIKVDEHGSQAVHRATRVPNTGKAVHLAWPREGQAAVAVDGRGTFTGPGAETPVSIASVAKVMTAYLVLRENPLEPGEEGFTMEVTEADVEDFHQRVDSNQSVVAVEAGEVLSERQALEALLLPSANNVAVMLAVHEAGSVEAFLGEMNEAAAELGMGKTRYTDPSGLEDTTVSTAADQLKLARAAMVDPTFREVVGKSSAVLPIAGEVTNFNGLVGHEGFVGIKTGSDDAAGGCLLFARRIEVGGHTRTVLGAVLGQRDGDLIQAALAAAKDLAYSAAAAVRGQEGDPARIARSNPESHQASSIDIDPGSHQSPESPTQSHHPATHTLRHTCASLLFANGRNIRQVSDWLGHADPAFTLRTYARATRGPKKPAGRPAAEGQNLAV
jgi:D-alanyl-D-alanine carboxypeptidase (penicillin-binding protein 5/6)